MSFQDIIHKVSIWIVLLPLFIGLLSIRRLGHSSLLVLTIVMLAAAPQLFTDYLPDGPLLNLFYNLYTPIELVLFFCLFLRQTKSKSYCFLLYVTLIVYIVMCSLLLMGQGIYERFLNELVCINHLLYFIWMLGFALVLSKETIAEVRFDSQTPFFWFFFGLILYAPCTMIVFALYHYIRSHPDSILYNLWVIHGLCNIGMYIAFSIGFFMDFRNNNVKRQINLNQWKPG